MGLIQDAQKVWRVCGYVSLMLIMSQFTVDWSYGNISTYAESYIRIRQGPNPLIGSPWVTAAYLSSWTLTITLCEYVLRNTPPLYLMIFAILFYNTFVFLSAFSVQHSMLLLIVTFGAFPGMGYGISVLAAFRFIAKWKNSRMGLVTAFVFSAENVNSLIVNKCVTLLVNSNNLPTDIRYDDNVYFSQTQILDRVPSIFLMLGAMSSSLQLVALVLLWFASRSLDKDKESQSLINSAPVQEFGSSSKEHKFSDGTEDDTRSKENLSSKHTGDSDVKMDEKGTSSPRNSSEIESVPVREILKTKRFYAIWFTIASVEFIDVLQQYYYKLFAQIWIRDDSYLADVGMVRALLPSGGRILWGLFVDRFGPKMSVITLASLNTTIISFWYFSPSLNRWVYFLWTGLLSSVVSSMIVVFPVVAQTHLGGNYNLVNSACFVADVSSPVLAKALVHNFGYLYVFLFAAMLNTVSVFLVATLVPSTV